MPRLRVNSASYRSARERLRARKGTTRTSSRVSADVTSSRVPSSASRNSGSINGKKRGFFSMK